MLGSNPYPGEPADINKLLALGTSGQSMDANFYRPQINVTFQAKISGGGVQQSPCTGCGDCVTGCNFGAKNTTLMNYLPDAVRHGAVIFTKCGVDHVSRQGERWVVHYQRLDSGEEAQGEDLRQLSADVVILAGGSLGSTEILLRSQGNGLALSPTLGTHFSGNGDVLGFGYNLNRDIDGIGWGHVPPGLLPKVGACITGIIDLRNQPELRQGMIIEEGSIPGGIGSVIPEALAGAAALAGEDLTTSPADRVAGLLREAESFVLGPHSGAAKRSQVYLVMTHDSGTREDEPGAARRRSSARHRLAGPRRRADLPIRQREPQAGHRAAGRRVRREPALAARLPWQEPHDRPSAGRLLHR